MSKSRKKKQTPAQVAQAIAAFIAKQEETLKRYPVGPLANSAKLNLKKAHRAMLELQKQSEAKRLAMAPQQGMQQGGMQQQPMPSNQGGAPVPQYTDGGPHNDTTPPHVAQPEINDVILYELASQDAGMLAFLKKNGLTIEDLQSRIGGGYLDHKNRSALDQRIKNIATKYVKERQQDIAGPPSPTKSKIQDRSGDTYGWSEATGVTREEYKKLREQAEKEFPGQALAFDSSTKGFKPGATPLPTVGIETRLPRDAQGRPMFMSMEQENAYWANKHYGPEGWRMARQMDARIGKAQRDVGVPLGLGLGAIGGAMALPGLVGALGAAPEAFSGGLLRQALTQPIAGLSGRGIGAAFTPGSLLAAYTGATGVNKALGTGGRENAWEVVNNENISNAQKAEFLISIGLEVSPLGARSLTGLKNVLRRTPASFWTGRRGFDKANKGLTATANQLTKKADDAAALAVKNKGKRGVVKQRADATAKRAAADDAVTRQKQFYKKWNDPKAVFNPTSGQTVAAGTGLLMDQSLSGRAPVLSSDPDLLNTAVDFEGDDHSTSIWSLNDPDDAAVNAPIVGGSGEDGDDSSTGTDDTAVVPSGLDYVSPLDGDGTGGGGGGGGGGMMPPKSGFTGAMAIPALASLASIGIQKRALDQMQSPQSPITSTIPAFNYESNIGQQLEAIKDASNSTMRNTNIQGAAQAGMNQGLMAERIRQGNLARAQDNVQRQAARQQYDAVAMQARQVNDNIRNRHLEDATNFANQKAMLEAQAKQAPLGVLASSAQDYLNNIYAPNQQAQWLAYGRQFDASKYLEDTE